MTSNPLHGSRADLLYSSDDISKEGVRELVASTPYAQAGKKYTATGDAQVINWTLDEQGRVYALVTTPQYPARVAFAAIDELQSNFKQEFGFRVATASENSLSKPARNLLKALCDKFADPKNNDILANVQGKIDVVKTQMKENISQLLINDEKLQHIEESTENLRNQSIEFQKGSNELRNKMFWKMWKMRLMIGGMIIIILTCIIAPVAATASKK